MNCSICNKPLYIEDGTTTLPGGTLATPYDERVPHALEHLSSEARGVAGLINSMLPALRREVIQSFCPECGVFTRHTLCDCGTSKIIVANGAQ